MRIFALVLGALHLFAPGGDTQRHGIGHWEGAIQVSGIALAIRVDLSVSGDSLMGTIDIPQQNATGLPLRGLRIAADSLSFELPAGPGLARFEGIVAGDSAHGVFRQAGVTGAFHLRRNPKEKTMGSEVPPPYKGIEVSFRWGEASLAGTLTMPRSPGPHPAIILLTGSGAQTRDEEVFGFKVFAALADTLTRAGLAVLRFDDPGTGASGGTAATTQAYGDIARAAFGFLKSSPGIDPRRIGLLGHSEGGIAAALAASHEPDVAFLVLMAGPALPGDSIILGQIEGLGRAAGMSAGEISEQLALQRRVYEAIRADAGWDSLKAVLFHLAQRGLPDSLARMQVESQVQVARSPWFRSFIDLDPAPVLRTLAIPVLALMGEKDMQVPAPANGAVFERLKAEGKKLTVVVVPGANHLFQEASTGHPREYATLKREFSREFLRALLPWVIRESGLRR